VLSSIAVGCSTSPESNGSGTKRSELGRSTDAGEVCQLKPPALLANPMLLSVGPATSPASNHSKNRRGEI